MKPKTIKDYLELLPKDISKKALKNLNELCAEALADNMKDAVEKAFIWANSPEGHNYWQKISEGKNG